ncbi:unannotated protein [freshwater metagenome]|uniref:Unannotated protein n=1 Tax=freshwater metagenome TaxID=449393 RepID=A0A6J6N306_9ZZZZ
MFVEKRLCTSTSADSTRSSLKSVKNICSSGVVNMPLYMSVRDESDGKYVFWSSTNSCSIRFRRINNLRSKSISVAPLGSSIKICINEGITRCALAPRHVGSTGTLRQPSVRNFCCATISSIRTLALIASSSSRGKNARPTP